MVVLEIETESVNDAVLVVLQFADGVQFLEETPVTKQDTSVAACIQNYLIAWLLKIKLLRRLGEGVRGGGFLAETYVGVIPHGGMGGQYNSFFLVNSVPDVMAPDKSC